MIFGVSRLGAGLTNATKEIDDFLEKNRALVDASIDLLVISIATAAFIKFGKVLGKVSLAAIGLSKKLFLIPAAVVSITTLLETFITENSGDIPSTITFSSDYDLNRFITFVDSTISAAANTEISVVANNTIANTVFFLPNLQDTVFSDDNEVIHIIRPNSIQSTLLFGDEEQLKFQLFILDQGVDSTLAIGTANVFVSTGPQPIESNVTFGDFDRPRPVHRSLIFKDDNITKLGNNDDVEIASGIVIQSSQQVSNTATSGENNLPDNPVGFVKITIDGVEYKMPYYNL